MPAALERCVKAVMKEGKVKNAHAVCRARMGTDEEIMRRSMNKKKKKPMRKM
jgi:hypothetical protein